MKAQRKEMTYPLVHRHGPQTAYIFMTFHAQTAQRESLSNQISEFVFCLPFYMVVFACSVQRKIKAFQSYIHWV